MSPEPFILVNQLSVHLVITSPASLPAFCVPAPKLGCLLKLPFGCLTLGQVYVLSLLGTFGVPLIFLLLLALRSFFLSPCKCQPPSPL